MHRIAFFVSIGVGLCVLCLTLWLADRKNKKYEGRIGLAGARATIVAWIDNL